MKKNGIIILISLFICLMILNGCGANPQTDEPVNLVWWVYGRKAPNALDEVVERANAISADRIGVTVEMIYKDEEQFDLDMATGEYYDMTFTCDWCNDFDDHARDGYYYDLTDLVVSETPKLFETVDPWWEIGSLNGRIYGVPMLKDLAVEAFFRMNSDYYEGEKGLTLPDEIAFSELEKYASMWKEDHPDEYPLYMTQKGYGQVFQCHENIVGEYLVIPYRYAGTSEGTVIIPIWDDGECMDMLRYMHKWYDAGYINPDAATTTDIPYSLHTPIRTGIAWSGFMGWSDPTVTGFNVKLVRFMGPYMSRSTQQGSLIAVNSAVSEERAEASLRYMELLYTDREFRDLLAYGIEGKHYNYYENTVIRTQAGSDDYLVDLFATGPVISASVVSAGEDVLADSDQWTRVYEGYEGIHVSDTRGFSFDDSGYETQTAALDAIWESYRSDLLTGTIDPDEAMGDMRTQMEAVGLFDLLSEAQRQLDSYLESVK
ncbi:ABC-type glycerol-3-phosphate transport system, substrate-binding protein [Lachnospiraceae bacterium XBB2008]|nr:ABC-type glycerol-3-phosphate transport system, substrate-binding protein [Lachnospiraceae bacterium XBB2008]